MGNTSFHLLILDSFLFSLYGLSSCLQLATVPADIESRVWFISSPISFANTSCHQNLSKYRLRTSSPGSIPRFAYMRSSTATDPDKESRKPRLHGYAVTYAAPVEVPVCVYLCRGAYAPCWLPPLFGLLKAVPGRAPAQERCDW